MKTMRALIDWALGQRERFTRFAVVGVSGASINLIVYAVLYYQVLRSMQDQSLRDNLAWVPGVALGLVNNFHWNRRWTWGDRDRSRTQPVWQQFGQYVTANWAGIVVTLAVKNLLSVWMPQLLAGMCAIGMACVINFLLNDMWTYRGTGGDGLDPEQVRIARIRLAIPLAITGTIIALSTYLFGLGSIYVPRNGDEWVYVDITRMTAANGHWLPLRSDMADMVNTKPPLLFWQGILSTDWGAHWSLWMLRWPGVLWTFLTAALCGLVAWRASGRDPVRGTIAALIYLAFFSTFRWGRPYCTYPIDTFFAFLGFFVLLWWRPKSFDSRFVVPTVLGILASLCMLSRSVVQLLPVGMGFAVWHMHARGWKVRAFLWRSAPGLAWIAVLSLGVFALMFLAHPDPAALWNESIHVEVGDKVRPSAGSWLLEFVWGDTSVWRLAFGWFENAGLLAFPLFGVMVEAWKHRREATEDERLLWLWVLVTFVVFSVPSVRSGRYLLEAMPALAVVMALRYHHVGRNAFMLSVGVSMAVMAGVGWVSALLAREIGVSAFDWWHFPLIVAAIGLGAVAFVRPAWTVPCTAPLALFVMLSLSGLLSVFDAPLGTFDQRTIEAVKGRVVWVPETWRASAEMHRFLLPGAEIRGFPASQVVPAEAQPDSDALLVIMQPIDAPPPANAVASRIDLAGRHTVSQIVEMATGQVQKHLFQREWLVPVTDRMRR